MKKIETAPFDPADYLDDEETIAEYMTAALEDPNSKIFLVAVRDVARARGMAQLARGTGLGRESIYLKQLFAERRIDIPEMLQLLGTIILLAISFGICSVPGLRLRERV